MSDLRSADWRRDGVRDFACGNRGGGHATTARRSAQSTSRSNATSLLRRPGSAQRRTRPAPRSVDARALARSRVFGNSYPAATRETGSTRTERAQEIHHRKMPAAVAANGASGPPQDALTYVRAVKTRFQTTNPQVYEAFLEVMRDFKNARCVKRRSPWRFLRSNSTVARRDDRPSLTRRAPPNAQVRHPRRGPSREEPSGRASRLAGRI